MNKAKLEKPLVSIISPCYNGETYLARFLDSILAQTYNNIELFLINDGSTDSTEDIALAYSKKFRGKNIEYHYIFQENRGQAAAINRGLKLARGDYLAWPDSDDVLTSTNIEEKVLMLEQNPHLDLVMCEAKVVDENNSTCRVIRRIPPSNQAVETLFADLIIEQNVIFPPGVYLVRFSSFSEVVPDCQIYPSRGGQNWQILLPVAYRARCGYIAKQLYLIYARHDSHSRSVVGLENELNRCDVHEDLLCRVISQMVEMPAGEKEIWQQRILQKYAIKRFELAFQFEDYFRAQEYYLTLKRLKVSNIRHATKLKMLRLPVILFLYKRVRLLQQLWRKHTSQCLQQAMIVSEEDEK